MIQSKTSLSSASLFQNLMMYLARTPHPHLYWRCASFALCILTNSSHSLQRIEYAIASVFLHLVHSTFLKNLLLTTRLYVSFYQSANKDYQRNYFHHYLRKKYPFFWNIWKVKKKTLFWNSRSGIYPNIQALSQRKWGQAWGIKIIPSAAAGRDWLFDFSVKRFCEKVWPSWVPYVKSGLYWLSRLKFWLIRNDTFYGIWLLWPIFWQDFLDLPPFRTPW